MDLDLKLFDNTLFTENVTVFGALAVCLGLIFYTASLPAFKKFYKIVPVLFMCYFLPAILNTTNIISDKEDAYKEVYDVAKYFFLPASLILLTLGADLKALFNLGWKPLLMFFAGTLGVIIGGPIALLFASAVFPEMLVAPAPNDELWRGMSTVAGSWIGGGANQNAMLEIYHYNKDLFGAMILMDIVAANIWMAVLLYGIEKRNKINEWLKADNSSVLELQEKVENYSESVKKYPQLKDYLILAAVTFGAVGLSFILAKQTSSYLEGFSIFSDPSSYFSSFSSSFLWLILYVTLFGVIISLTKARSLEGFGASKIGSVFIYLLVAAIGVHMNIAEIFNKPEILIIGLVWIFFHVAVLLITAKLIKAPYFFVAVGSQANIGGAASAPVVAAAFHPSLAPVGALLAIFGYIVGTIGAIGCTILMQMV